SPKAVSPGEHNFEILLTLENVLALGDSVTVEVLAIKSSAGKENIGIVDRLLYADGIQDLHILNPRLIHVLHKSALDKAEAEKAVFSLKDQDVNIQTLLHQTDPRLLQLVLDHPLNPDTFYDLVIPQRTGL